jgi:hypothetical protein
MPARTTEPSPLPPTLPRLPERPERLVIPPTHLLAPAAGASADLRERLLARRIVLRRPSARSDGRGPVPADVLAAYRWECAEITARHSGRSVDEVLADTEAERWFTAEEAVGAGLVDRVG